MLAGLQEFSELKKANRAIPKYKVKSNFQAGKATHISHAPRGPQWELQPMHHSMPPHNASESESDKVLSEPSPPGLVLRGSQSKRELVQPAPQPQQSATLSHPIQGSCLTARASHTAASPQHRCQSRLHSTRDVHCSTGFVTKSNLRQKQEKCATGGQQTCSEGDQCRPSVLTG